jgi:hypothetical protein
VTAPTPVQKLESGEWTSAKAVGATNGRPRAADRRPYNSTTLAVVKIDFVVDLQGKGFLSCGGQNASPTYSGKVP